jgi:hypothetical protein
MRPEDVVAPAGRSAPVPIDAELEALDAELERAGSHARRTLNGQRQPTRYFALELRRALLEAVEASWPGQLARSRQPPEVAPIIRR